MEYIQLTPAEVKKFVEQYNQAGDIAIARKIIAQYYGTNAYKVFIKYASEYNDEGYDISCVVIVLDKDMRELDAKGGLDIGGLIVRELHDSSSMEDEPDPLTFYMSGGKGLPNLYIKAEEYDDVDTK